MMSKDKKLGALFNIQAKNIKLMARRNKKRKETKMLIKAVLNMK